MRWKYQDAKKVYRIDSDHRTINGKCVEQGMIQVNGLVVANLERELGFPVRGNIELILQVVGVRIPPNQWCRVEDRIDVDNQGG